MIYSRKLQNLFLLILALQKDFVQAAEQEDEIDRDREITSYVEKYRHLREGFDILQNIDATIPTFYNFLDTNIVNNDENLEPNLGEVIEQAEDIIAQNMQNPFYNIINEDVNTLKQVSQIIRVRKNSFDYNSSNQPIQIKTRKTIPSHAINEFNFNTNYNPVFQYVMQYKDNFMNPIVKDWIQSHKNNYIKLLDQAIEFNHVPLAAFILDMGIDPNSNIFRTISLLGSAVYYQRPEITELFLAAGAGTNVLIFNPDHGYETLLTEAVKYDDIATIDVLLRRNIDLNAFNSAGKNPLLIAIERQNRELLHILLHAGAHPNVQDTLQNSTDVHFFNARSHIFEHTYNTQLANSLPNFNINTHGRDIYGDSPLIIAAHNNFTDITRILIQAGANLNTANIFYGTALQIAQRNNYSELCEILLQAGALEYIPAQRFWPHTNNLFLPPLSSSLDNKNYFITRNNFTQNQENTWSSFDQSTFDFNGSANDLFSMQELSNIDENNDLFRFLTQDNQTLLTENHIPATENLIIQDEIETPVVDLFDFLTTTIHDQIAAIENLTLQDVIEIPAAPAEDQTQPKIKKRKRLVSSDESQVNEPDKVLDFSNKKSK